MTEAGEISLGSQAKTVYQDTVVGTDNHMNDTKRHWVQPKCDWHLMPFDTEFEARAFAAAHEGAYKGEGTEYDMTFGLLVDEPCH
jgi:hypothetical protein